MTRCYTKEGHLISKSSVISDLGVTRESDEGSCDFMRHRLHFVGKSLGYVSSMTAVANVRTGLKGSSGDLSLC